MTPIANRTLAGQVNATLLAGGSYSSAADVGEVRVVNFYASWCGPCSVESPEFEAVYRARKSSGIRFVGLDVKDPSKSSSRHFVSVHGLTYPIVWDETAKTALQLGKLPIAGLPDTVLIDKHNRIAAVWAGMVLPKDLNPALDQLSAES